MIELHSKPTPNGQKVMIMLEETGLEWKHIDVDISTGEQFTTEYIKLSPNNKIPAIIDTEGPGGRYTMMESGAILIYLAEKTGKFLPKDARKRYDTLQWLIFQMAHVGPMFGQANHFRRYAKDKIEYAVERYTNEANRLTHVLDKQLAQSKFVACDEYTIADMAIFPWMRGADSRGIDMNEYPNVKRWFDGINARPAVQRALQVLSNESNSNPVDDKAREVMFGKTQFQQR